jgi:hypothetical protein
VVVVVVVAVEVVVAVQWWLWLWEVVVAVVVMVVGGGGCRGGGGCKFCGLCGGMGFSSDLQRYPHHQHPYHHPLEIAFGCLLVAGDDGCRLEWSGVLTHLRWQIRWYCIFNGEHLPVVLAEWSADHVMSP